MSLEDFRARRADQKRTAIVEAASELFAERGVDRVSMAAIANAAGVSTATVYRHFEDKEDLFGAVLDRLVADVLTADEAPPANGNDGLLAVAFRYGRLLSQPRVQGLVRAVISSRGGSGGLADRLGRHGKAIFAKEFRREIRRLEDEGAVDPEIDLDRARSELQGMIEHYTLTRGLLFDQRPSPRKLREQVEDSVETWFARWGKR
ncbi:MAG: TetR/AcrR family transcriptional regulator [Myxococcota bacterium]|nr:TetR/AcrR family transcriptional regulator [Myxococcota bacterium]